MLNPSIYISAPSSFLIISNKTGIAVSSTGRKFTSYASSLDPNNTAYQVAELTSNGTETPYPSLEINSPPGGAINNSASPAVGATYENYLISIQGISIDALDRLWLLDNDRPLTKNWSSVPASPGGPKLVGVDLSTNQVIKTITFPASVASANSYLNDVRVDARSTLAGTAGQGVAYITDSATPGIIIVDLGSGESWRHLDNTPQVRPEPSFVAFVWGESTYGSGQLTYGNYGADGLTLSADGETLYFTSTSSRYLYSVPTARLLARDTFSELLATQSIISHGQKGWSDGIETDSNDAIYVPDIEINAINIYFPGNGTVGVFVRDPRLAWMDSLAVAADGYLYWTSTQLWRTPGQYPGTDRRVPPYALFRVPCPDGGKKVILK